LDDRCGGTGPLGTDVSVGQKIATIQYLGQFHTPELYFSYGPAFKALNGSTSRLSVDWTAPDDANGRNLSLDLNTGELYEDTSSGRLDYNPARAVRRALPADHARRHAVRHRRDHRDGADGD